MQNPKSAAARCAAFPARAALVAFALLASLTALAPRVTHAERQLVDRTVAFVDDAPILLSEVVQEMNLVRLQRDLGDLDEAQQKQLYDKVLDEMISDALLVAQAKAKGYEVGEDELRAAVDEAVLNIKQRVGGEERYRAELQKQGLTEAEVRDMHKEQKRKQILASRVIQAEVRRQIAVSDDQVRTAWETERDSIPPQLLSMPTTYRLEHILVVPRPDPAKVEAARAKLAAAQKRVAAGEDFAKVAKEVSEWPTAQNGGFLGAFRYGDFESEAFDATVAKLEPGQVSDVIETRFGLQIVKLESRNGDEMTARHIVIKLEVDENAQVRALEKAIGLRERILRGESFDAVARAESDDPNTRDQGGRVQEELPATELLPEFRAAIDSVAVGAVTRVVRSQSGFHLFKVTGRSEAREATFADLQEPLRRWLEQREVEKRYRAYLAELRQKFHVEIKA
jgi:peptidyl-prolyl cis-trans isomerase SurA